jgi:hypothetical protein
MAIVINLSDPGAVPGVSTNYPALAGQWGRNRIDEGVKGVFSLGMALPLSGHPK